MSRPRCLTLPPPPRDVSGKRRSVAIKPMRVSPIPLVSLRSVSPRASSRQPRGREGAGGGGVAGCTERAQQFAGDTPSMNTAAAAAAAAGIINRA